MTKIRKIIKNRRNIITGIKNWLIRKNYTEQLYKERMAICAKCPHLSKTDEGCMMPKTQPCCSLCGCSLKLKLRDPASACDISKWKAIQNQIK